ncbi:MAG: beta galactosidase jelly roll domain-containing protein, partial [Armatimonadota bacterium]|nr:beta galactosidase jelly roll domain-containing protein [Armatimonadota bacterium]
MDRERLSLNGNWKFMVSSAERLSATTMLDMESIRVPSCWESELPGLVAGAQMAWYQRTFTAPAHWAQTAVVLYFGAVNYFCQVFLNGILVGEHEGGYTPFSFRIEKLLQNGENLLEVAVTNPAAAMARFPYDVAPDSRTPVENRLSLEEIPYGKQSWYGSGSGIWQAVWVESRPLCHIQTIVITPDIDRSEARMVIRLSEGAPAGHRLTVDVEQFDL